MAQSPSQPPAAPRLSIVIVIYDMAREAKRSLHSLSTDYQAGIEAGDYEVIVVDNGSPEPPEAAEIAAFGSNFRYLPIPAEAALPSPCAAINRGVAMARGCDVGIMIDGARIATPGTVALALQALSRFDRAVVATIGYHLGPAMQTWAAETGYDQAAEDALLDSIGWPAAPYRLYEIGVLTGVNWSGWLGPMAESNLIFLSREMYDEAGGFNERFDLPGGELANLDFYTRATDLPGSTLISLFGEATFHQIHGGAMSSRSGHEIPGEIDTYLERYRAIRGEEFRFSTRVPLLFGRPRPEIMASLAESCRPDRPHPSTPPAKSRPMAVER